MPVPSPKDIRDFLEGYGLDSTSTYSKTGVLSVGVALITGISTTGIKLYDRVNHANIPAGSFVTAITVDDPTNGTIEISAAATLDTPAATLVFTTYPCLSDQWLVARRDNFVLPWIEEKSRKSFRGIQTADEFYDGTGASLLILRNRPIIDLINVSYVNVDTNLYYLTPTAIRVIKEEGILKAKANFNESSYIPIFYRGVRNIRVQYTYGYADCPADVAEAIKYLCAEQALGFVGSKTGGGDLGVQSYNRSFGGRGKWTHIRNDFARQALGLLRKYMTGT